MFTTINFVAASVMVAAGVLAWWAVPLFVVGGIVADWNLSDDE